MKQQIESPIADHFHYKLVIFASFLVGAILAILGPFYFANAYFIFCVFVLTSYCIKCLGMFAVMVHNWFKFKSVMKYQPIAGDEDFATHVFIIPNFKEDVQILKQTIAFLASHPLADRYCVFLAMERHEAGSEDKAIKLVRQFKGTFKVLSYTLHELQPGQAKSKNSNINWCGTHMAPVLLENGVNLDQVFITIQDADSLIPKQYVDQMNKHIRANYEERHKYIYQAPQVFTRNAKEVQFFVRGMDFLMSYIHFSAFYSVFKFTTGVSNYTISYRLIEKIGFWDTCEFSRGEDMRTPSKAYWKTDGNVETYPIYVPTAQMSLMTGHGFIADFKARFQQAKRHCQVQIESSYNLTCLFRKKNRTLRDYYIAYNVIDPFFCMAFIPIPMIVFILQNALPLIPRAPIDDGTYFIFYNVLNAALVAIGFIFYHFIRKQAVREIYKNELPSAVHTILMPFASSIYAMVFAFAPTVLAGYNLMNNTYNLASAPKGVQKAKCPDGTFEALSILGEGQLSSSEPTECMSDEEQ